ncbi:MAG: NTP transferase domain-containing protein [Betaproteobacteria bacterium]|nr:NTP transferase domain-containing protein [Betaproteobacteria bacterium]
MRASGILLAAGSGTRFGGGKLVQPFPPDGTPLALVAYRNLRRVLDQVTVVTRPSDESVRAVFSDTDARVIVCEDAERGMGSSLACGIRATPSTCGWLIALGDMPLVRESTLRAVAEALERGASIAIPACEGRRGHPVGFAATYGKALEALSGDEGARSVLRAHPGSCLEIPVDDPGILADVDTREDLQRLSKRD